MFYLSLRVFDSIEFNRTNQPPKFVLRLRVIITEIGWSLQTAKQTTEWRYYNKQRMITSYVQTVRYEQTKYYCKNNCRDRRNRVLNEFIRFVWKIFLAEKTRFEKKNSALWRNTAFYISVKFVYIYFYFRKFSRPNGITRTNAW